MKFAFFYHSVTSDWNNGNAHFLRGLMRALKRRGQDVVCFEEAGNWSLSNLLLEEPDAVERFRRNFPDLPFEFYTANRQLECWLRQRLAGVDVALVHEWNEPPFVRLVTSLCRELGVRCLFHDTHYRVVLDDGYRQNLDLDAFDGILAYSPSLAERYEQFGHQDVHVFHEAADLTVFGPRNVPQTVDVVFVGNCGEEDRRSGLDSLLFGPRRALRDLNYAIYGVRYPEDLLKAMNNGLNIDFRGRLANVDVPEVYSAAKVVMHIPRRPYLELLPGTPTIRVFEALASGACLLSAPWPDTDGLFTANSDYVVAATPCEVRDAISWLCRDEASRRGFGRRGRQTIEARHTCDHRAAQLLEIVA